MPHVFVESPEEFIARHSTETDGPLQDPTGTRWLLPTGASLSTDEQRIRSEPPADEAQRLLAQLKYRMLRLKLAETNFSRSRTSFTEQLANSYKYPNLPHVDEESAVLQLEGLRDEVYKQRDLLDAVQQRYDSLPHVVAERERQERRRQEQAIIRQAHDRVSQITLDGETQPSQADLLREATKQLHAASDALAVRTLTKKMHWNEAEATEFVNNFHPTIRPV